MKMKGLVLFITLFSAISLLTGCFDGINIPLGDGESIKIGSDNEGVSIDFEGQDGESGGISFSSDGEFTIEDGDGKATVHNKIPEHFPSELPIPDGVTPMDGYVTEVENNDGAKSFIVRFELAKDREEEVTKLYTDFINDNGYELVEELNDGLEFVLAGEKESGFIHVTMLDSEEHMIVSVNYTNYGEQATNE